MADLPELSDSTKRNLALRWDALLDTHQLTGDDLLRWIAAQAALGYWRNKSAADETGIPYGDWARHRIDAMLNARTADQTGLRPSVTVSEARFQDLSAEYWRLWARSGAEYEVFVAWLEEIKRQVSDEIRSVWRDKSDVVDRWYQSACEPAVERTLAALMKAEINRARAAELKRPEASARGSESGFPKANQADATEPGGNEPNRTNVGPTVGTTVNGADRRAVLEPILLQKGYSRSRWAYFAGVDVSVVYGYLKGTSNPTPESRKALAGAIGLSVDALPM